MMELTESINSVNIEEDCASHYGATGRLSIIIKDPILAQVYFLTNSDIFNLKQLILKRKTSQTLFTDTLLIFSRFCIKYMKVFLRHLLPITVYSFNRCF